MAAHECTRCGACCVAPDIAALDKPLGLRCPHLGPDNLCTVYDQRPQVCRSYAADELCKLIEAPTLEERVAKYLAHFDLTEEARQVRETRYSPYDHAKEWELGQRLQRLASELLKENESKLKGL